MIYKTLQTQMKAPSKLQPTIPPEVIWQKSTGNWNSSTWKSQWLRAHT